MKEIPKVLFICVANAGKSQMAEAIARAKYATQFIALSAGTNPKTTTNALAAKSVAEIGTSMDSASPKPIAPTILRTADRVVIIGDAAHVELPSDAQGSLERWLTDEPSKRGIDGKERMDLIRDDLERRIDELAVELRSTKNP
ncbi:low molecular weight phosphatase family protein [Corynebacterium sp. 045007]|uniref:arsenate-mycothiol transferase ArsC n=1 Tax=Corynebacterium sp. 045007 TaxID=3156078 RepID=UPI00345C0D5F